MGLCTKGLGQRLALRSKKEATVVLIRGRKPQALRSRKFPTVEVDKMQEIKKQNRVCPSEEQRAEDPIQLGE